jgi:hypothetical protein
MAIVLLSATEGHPVISFNWVITVPKHLTEETFDDWYLGKHTEYAKIAHKIVRYCINRRVSEQPAVAHGEFFRIAQEYWETWDDMVACWNHHSGYALLGDGMAYMGLDPGTLPGIALTEETQFDVARPAQFSTIRRGYRARPDGTISKLIAFGMANDRGGIKEWYAKRFAGLGKDPLVREHVFGTTVGKTIRLGYIATLPNPNQTCYDWNLELWFESNADAHSYLKSAPFNDMFSQLRSASSDTIAGLFRGQEMLMLNTAMRHRDE